MIEPTRALSSSWAGPPSLRPYPRPRAHRSVAHRFMPSRRPRRPHSVADGDLLGPTRARPLCCSRPSVPSTFHLLAESLRPAYLLPLPPHRMHAPVALHLGHLMNWSGLELLFAYPARPVPRHRSHRPVPPHREHGLFSLVPSPPVGLRSGSSRTENG